jgi:hypothetical protein
MESTIPPVRTITLPAGAAPGSARIVIGPDLPPPLDTYVCTVLGTSHFSGAIIFYSTDAILPLDDTYSFIGVLDNGLAAYTAVVYGMVRGGAVVERSAGIPEGIIQYAQGAGVVSVLNTAHDQVAIHADQDVDISSGTTLNLDPGTELRLQSIRAYMLTQIGTAAASASLTLSTTPTDVTGATLTLATVTANAKYEATITCDIQETVAGTTVGIGQLVVDGATQTQAALLACNATDDRATVTQVFTGNLATAGNHTFKIQGSKDIAAGTVIMNLTHTTISVKIWESGG